MAEYQTDGTVVWAASIGHLSSASSNAGGSNCRSFKVTNWVGKTRRYGEQWNRLHRMEWRNRSQVLVPIRRVYYQFQLDDEHFECDTGWVRDAYRTEQHEHTELLIGVRLDAQESVELRWDCRCRRACRLIWMVPTRQPSQSTPSLGIWQTIFCDTSSTCIAGIPLSNCSYEHISFFVSLNSLC